MSGQPEEAFPTLPPREPLMEIIRGFWRFSALTAIVELRCADHLRDGPLTAEELAARCGARAPLLARVLRAVAAAGIVEIIAPDKYALTEAGLLLTAERPDSLRTGVLFNAEPELARVMLDLAGTIRTGQSSITYGSFYEYLHRTPETGQVFNDYMHAKAHPLIAAVAERYDFSRIKTLVDVGGGQGHYLAAILSAHPHISGVLYDREHILPDARRALRPFSDRCDMVAGDFFTSVPKRADAYLLSSILHNWDDSDALRILHNIRASMTDNGVMLVVETVIPDDNNPHLGKDLDIRMLGLFVAGQERTRSEYSTLLEQAGLRLGRLIELPDSVSLLEAVPSPSPNVR